MSSCSLKPGELCFRDFIHHWNNPEGRLTPDLHINIADWLEMRWTRKKTRALLMAFRGAGKSTLAALFAAWLLYKNSNLRILVLAADFSLSRKMVRQVKRIVERHPQTAFLRPEEPDQWAGDRFTVKRDTELRDPSMLARGITSNITGSRADIIICDDVEVPQTCDSPQKRHDLRERLDEINYVLVPGGTQLYLGTPHDYFSIYASEPRAQIGEEQEFLSGFERLEIPLLDEKGTSVWPEKFTAYEIEQTRARTGPNKFASQMMLRPVSLEAGRLDGTLMNIYGDDLDYTKELRTLFLDKRKLVSSSAFWDPAYGSEKGDSSVLAVIFKDEMGDYFLHRIEYIKNPSPLREREGPIGAERRREGEGPDAATFQCRRVAQIAKELYLPALTVESNGLGKFLPGILRQEIKRANLACAVKEFPNNRPKDARILEAFDAPLAALKIHVHSSVLKTPFMTEMAEWRPGQKTAHDDGLDAAAGALAQAFARFNFLRPVRGHKAQTDFEI